MKYFITGGAGFIGSTIIEHLSNENLKNTVTIFDNLSSGKIQYVEKYLRNKNFKLIKSDMLDFKYLKEAMKEHDIVFHLAANPDIAKSLSEPDIDLKLGIIATFNVLESMRLNNIKKIVFTSGSGVYGNVGLTETSEDFGPLIPTSMYGASKLSAEGLISAFCHMFDMQSWIFRLANVVGRNQTHGVGYDFIRKLKENPTNLVILGSGEQSKSYIHASDVINAIHIAMKKTNEMVNVLNVATDDYITVKEIAKIVTDELNLKNVTYEYTGGFGGWKGDVPIVRFNLKKIHKLGWKAKYSSKNAIRKSIREMLGKE